MGPEAAAPCPLVLMRLIRNTCVTLLLAAALWTLGLRYTASYRHNRELTRKLPYFEKVVSDLEATTAVPPASFVQIPVREDAGHMAYAIFAQRLADGRLAVEFLTGGGFPVVHRGFLFLSSGGIEDFPEMASRWPLREPMRDRWLYIGD